VLPHYIAEGVEELDQDKLTIADLKYHAILDAVQHLGEAPAIREMSLEFQGNLYRKVAVEIVFDPLHYLALLEQKTRALDQAAPLAGLAVAGVLRSVAASARSQAQETRQPRVRAGASPAGDLRPR
jgi:hypothetical protein